MSLDESQTREVEYRAVLGFPNYRVGDDGNVWSKGANTKGTKQEGDWHLIIGGLDKDGYRKIILSNGGRKKHVRVNVLVLTAFCGAPPVDLVNPTAAHSNNVKTDNRLCNLRWASQKDNIGDKVKHGTAQIGEKHPQAKLTEADVRLIRSLRAEGKKWREIAETLGRKLITVQAAGSGRNWSHLSPSSQG